MFIIKLKEIKQNGYQSLKEQNDVLWRNVKRIKVYS